MLAESTGELDAVIRRRLERERVITDLAADKSSFYFVRWK